ncbi:uncharacterized protein LOC135466152 [Liolophura sinensis]|uniref:uncharacterized protein LOC135466152 n=1 Tax=Liolophura sinensis TaxID=3198878 RepID=UPI0031597D13
MWMDGVLTEQTYSVIIKTNESIADKAVFLDFLTGKTKEDCLQSCCSLSDCNLAVYENKDDRNCYLFNCGTGEKSRCHFARHEGYMIMTLSGKSSQPKSPLTKLKESQHEDELEGLMDQKAEILPNKDDVKPTIRPKIETTAAPLKSEDPDAGQLYSECADGLYCDDDNAVCRRGVCVCKSGYNSRSQTCRAPHEESLQQLSSQNPPPEGRDGRPPISTSAAKDDHVDSPQAEEQELPAFAPSVGKAWAEQSSEEDKKQSAEVSEMREDTVAPAKMIHSPEKELQETKPSLKKEKVLNSDVIGEPQTGYVSSTHSPKADGKSHSYQKPQTDADRASIGEGQGQGPGEEPQVSRPESVQPEYPSRPKPYQLSHRPGVMRGPTADRQPDGQPVIQPDSQTNIQPVRQPNIQPMRQPVRQPNMQPFRQPVRQPGRQPVRQPNRQPVRQPLNPRTRYPYPYNIDADRSQVPQYPVQYPSYEWDYRPDEYGGSFRGEDYNPGPLDQGGYDYPYRHSNFGPDDIPVSSKSHINRVKVNHGKVPESAKSPAEHMQEPPVMATAKPSTQTTARTPATTPAPTPGWKSSQSPLTTTTIVSTSQSTPKPPVSQSQNSTGGHLAEEVNGARDVAVEQIIIASPTDSAQGPIVALALGLAFTVMLLIFVGCRLRNVKRRIRKGRALHSNEADYLINGMYL